MVIEDNPKFCPECHKHLAGVDPIAHALSHWPEYLDPAKSSAEARKRQKLMVAGGVTLAEYKKLRGEAG